MGGTNYQMPLNLKYQQSTATSAFDDIARFRGGLASQTAGLDIGFTLNSFQAHGAEGSGDKTITPRSYSSIFANNRPTVISQHAAEIIARRQEELAQLQQGAPQTGANLNFYN